MKKRVTGADLATPTSQVSVVALTGTAGAGTGSTVSISGRAAVITGAGRGIGRGLAVALARAGHPVALQARTAETLAETLAEVEKVGGRGIAVPGDVTQDSAAAELVARATEAFGPVGVAVACAGQAHSAPLLKTAEADLRRLLDINVIGPFHLLKAAGQAMKTAGQGGRLVVIGSTASVKGARYTSAYSASKHAVLGLVRSAALELARDGITVNALCPGWVDTPMFDQTLDNIVGKTGRSRDEARTSLATTIPTGRVLPVEEVAAALAWIVSDAAAEYTGQALVLDGGTSL